MALAHPDVAKRYTAPWKGGVTTARAQAFLVAGIIVSGKPYEEAIDVAAEVISGAGSVWDRYSDEPMVDADQVAGAVDLIKKQRALIMDAFGDRKTITVYRGCASATLQGKTVKDGDIVELEEKNPMTRWALSRATAEDFAYMRSQKHGGQASALISREIPINKILYMDVLNHGGLYIGEGEVAGDFGTGTATIERVYAPKSRRLEGL